jgi:hypothetical protein
VTVGDAAGLAWQARPIMLFNLVGLRVTTLSCNFRPLSKR